MTRKSIFPFLAFLVVVGFLAVGLQRDPSLVPSPFIGKPAPAFSLPDLLDNSRTVRNGDFRGEVWIFNVWASWCAACRDEHPLFHQLAALNLVPIVGLNYKDKAADARAWLDALGNPYTVVVTDESGDTGVDYGVYGVPETFVVDREGIVRLKHIGPLNAHSMQSEIIPLVKSLLL